MSRLAGYSVSCPGGGSSYVTTRPLLCQGEFRRKPLLGAVLLALSWDWVSVAGPLAVDGRAGRSGPDGGTCRYLRSVRL